MKINFNSDYLHLHTAAFLYIAAMQIPGIYITSGEDADVVINIDSIQKTGLKKGKVTVYYEHDDVMHRGKNSQWYDVDLLYTTSPHVLSYYPPKTKNLFAAMEPSLHFHWDELPDLYELGFIGQERDIPAYQYRRQIIPLLAKKFTMMRGQCQPQDYYKLLSQVKIPVNVMPQEDNLPLVNMRFYESIAVGCLLNDYHPILDEIAEEGIHYVGFTSPEESIAKARFYLDRDDLRKKIAKEGRIHMLAHHTWKHRLLQIMKDVEAL